MFLMVLLRGSLDLVSQKWKHYLALNFIHCIKALFFVVFLKNNNIPFEYNVDLTFVRHTTFSYCRFLMTFCCIITIM